jgi:lysophospholipase L1-like esterase
MLGKGAEMDAYVGEPPLNTQYRLNYHNQSNQPIQGLPSLGKLVVKQNPLLGYQLLEKQQNPIVQINDQGFRTGKNLDRSKAQTEVRILVLGGSTAFGQLAPNNETLFSQQLETRLNQQVQEQRTGSKNYRPDVLPYYADEQEKALKLPPKIRDAQYRVINAAVPGYTSGNTLAQISQLLAYQPNAIVLLDGYSDLLSPQGSATIPNLDSLTSNATSHLLTTVTTGLRQFFGQWYLAKTIPFWLTKPQTSIEDTVDPSQLGNGKLVDRLPKDDAELKQRTERYQANLQQLSHLAAGAKLPVFYALQPEISQRSATNISKAEKSQLDRLGPDYGQKMQKAYSQMQQVGEAVKKDNPNLIVLNPKERIDRIKGDAFLDPVSLTSAGHQAIADQLYEAIAPRLQVQAKPFSGSAPGAYF